MSNTITITGRATADADLKYTPGGMACASFTVADNHSKKVNGEWVDDGATFLRVKVWKHQAEECAERVRKGTRVTVTGQLRQQNWETKDGEKRTTFEVNAQEVAITVPKSPPKESKPAEDPWGNAPASGTEFGDAPF